MAKFELKLPKMGESVAEATVTNWLKNVGDTIEADEAVLEIATDKVDSEVPSEVDGVLVEILFNTDDVVQVGQTLAIIETEGEATATQTTEASDNEMTAPPAKTVEAVEATVTAAKESTAAVTSSEGRFYSPLVKNMASEEGIAQDELDAIAGTGKDGRVTKNDMLDYISNRGAAPADQPKTVIEAKNPVAAKAAPAKPKAPVSVNGGDEIIEMTRMGKLIAHHMVESVQTSAHVQSFIEADVTNIWNWRKKVKDAFMKREGENLTFTPIFMEAVAKALKDFPMMNIALDGDTIIKRKNINLGMAAALPDGNLIVPVIKNADQLNLVGMTKAVNDLAGRARENKLKPDDIQGGTYTVTNVGTFGSIMGTPIINQPQVGILALGAIRKVPAVIETPDGDFIGIRYKMFLSHSYDHRVVNGALGGQFVKAVADYLENWDSKRDI
ncbi:dihydrolipoamide acetyltransferase component of pyruvate dehydrogenase complex [Patiriisocius marinistellae]|uniref:Dihydrolipoamide acetyltransferase component of pyruvate dehydrogenase complex n=1 Tax=Patiriisocius marinistellae TaxID=2494560 RepID=A0A5J4FV14_9FLAO|nr:dihydrolipoamide acetyltransferase family protein [Patiriisocius marinistellae]GEQ85780.1 dihydrolipoamide acetyltransferase component of pyruvate dehydrogenase complex [Patiriisocius marinistellae]